MMHDNVNQLSSCFFYIPVFPLPFSLSRKIQSSSTQMLGISVCVFFLIVNSISFLNATQYLPHLQYVLFSFFTILDLHLLIFRLKITTSWIGCDRLQWMAVARRKNQSLNSIRKKERKKKCDDSKAKMGNHQYIHLSIRPSSQRHIYLKMFHHQQAS